MDEVSSHTLFPSQDIKQNMLLSFYLDSWWRHKLRVRQKKQKICISQEWKELFRWNKKTFFIVFEGLTYGEK